MERTKINLTDKRILVVGPGALGVYFSARLGQCFKNLWVLDHRADRAQDLAHKGFHVRGATTLDWQPRPGHVASSATGWPVMDVAIVLVKAASVAKAVASAGRAVGRTTRFLCLQNGWGSERAVEIRWGKQSVVVGLTHEGVTLEGTGRAFHAGLGATLLNGKAPAALEVADLLTRAGFLARVEKNFEKERRLKLLINACVNPVGALAGVVNARLLEPPLRSLVGQAAREAWRLCGLLGTPLDWKVVEAQLLNTLTHTAENRNSMSQDVARGIGTERAYLLGPLLAVAKRKKIPAPTLAGMDRLLRALESKAKDL